MAQNENDAQFHGVEELLVDLEQRGLSGEVFAGMASVADMALTKAHLTVTDARVHDGTVDWPVLAQLAEQTVACTQLASRAAELMLICAVRKRAHN